MAEPETLSAIAIGVSGVSALISLFVGSRQIIQFRRVNHFPVVADMLGEFRKAEFHMSYDYVVNKLQDEHSLDLGIMNLPEPARSDVINIAFYFQTFASLRRFKILRESKNLGNLYLRTVEVWDAIAPYVMEERKNAKGQANEHTLALLEQYALRLKKKAKRGKRLPWLVVREQPRPTASSVERSAPSAKPGESTTP
jgi:hypothetical protein